MEGNAPDVYSIIEEHIEEYIEVKQPALMGVVLRKILIFFRTRYPELIIALGYLVSIYQLLSLGSSLVWAIYYLDADILPSFGQSVITNIIIPCATWLYATCNDYWSFRNRKMFGLIQAFINAVLILEMFTFKATSILVLPAVFKIPIGSQITPGMVLMLGRLIEFIVLCLVALSIAVSIFKNMFHAESVAAIMHFKLNRNFDSRKNKWYCYDMNIVRYLSTGKMHKVYEEDRFLHCMFVGSTGTGKTSTCMTVSINNDLDQRVSNEDWQKKKLYKLLRAGHIRMTKDFDDANFSASYFEADKKKYKKKLKKIQEFATSVGITAMAPNEKFSDELYKLAKAKSIRANRIDPNLDINGHHKLGFIGFNPLYISPKIKGVDRKLEIFSKARVFADVNQAIFEKDESGDIYFTGLNRNITTSAAIVVLLTYPYLHGGKQPTPDVVQNVINNFDKIKPYRDELVRQYSTKFNRGNEDPVLDVGVAEIREYQFVLDVIDKDLLGIGRTKMEDQARGLRNIINETLSNPLIKDVLCAENTIDMDEILDKGEVTLINFAINLGSAGTAFGMFFLLSFISAILRRPAHKKLIPHFINIDELPEILHPDIGRALALARQYKVGFNIALQSLDQFDKSAKTKYLKNVVVGGTSQQIIYGRCSTAEMKLYQDLSGMKNVSVDQVGVNETAMTTENPSMSINRRTSREKVNNVEGGDMRYRDFREVTMFSVTKGSPNVPFFGKTFFLEDIKKIERRRYVVDWHKYFKEQKGFQEPVEKIGKNAVKESSTEVIDNEKLLDNPEIRRTLQTTAEKISFTSVENNERNIENPDNERCWISSGKNQEDDKENEGQGMSAENSTDVMIDITEEGQAKETFDFVIEEE